MRSPIARSLTLDLLSTLAGGSMPVAALVEAGRILGIQSGSVRVALARLLADGRIERAGRARYRLGTASAPVEQLVRSWRHLEARTRPWSGGWLTVHLPGGTPRNARKRSLRALRLLGFAPFGGGLHLRPANLRDDPVRIRATLCALHLEDGALSGELQELDPHSRARATGLWDREALLDASRRMRGALETSAARLPGLDEERAMAESFLVGGQAIQQLVRDPLLPEEILPSHERTALVETLRRYDAQGRTCWAAFLARFDVLSRATPQDTRVAAGLDRLRPTPETA